MHPCLSSLEAFVAAPLAQAAEAVFLFAFVDPEGLREVVPDVGLITVRLAERFGYTREKKQIVDSAVTQPWATVHGVVDEAVIHLENRFLASRRLRGTDYPGLSLVALRRGLAAAQAGTLAQALA